MPKHNKRRLNAEIHALIKSNPLMYGYSEAITIGITNHKYPQSVLRALTLVQEIGLFQEETSAKINFKKIIQHKYPEDIADIMMMMHSTLPPAMSDKADVVLQDYFNYITKDQHRWFVEKAMHTTCCTGGLSMDEKSFWLQIAIAYGNLLLSSELLTGAHAQFNLNALFNPNIHYLARTLAPLLAYTELLTGPSAQSNFDSLFTHSNPQLLSETLTLLVENTQLFDNELIAQKNYNALLSKTKLHEIIPTLYEMLDEDLNPAEMQSFFDELIGPHKPKKKAHRLPGFFNSKSLATHGLVENATFFMVKPSRY